MDICWIDGRSCCCPIGEEERLGASSPDGRTESSVFDSGLGATLLYFVSVDSGEEFSSSRPLLIMVVDLSSNTVVSGEFDGSVGCSVF